MPARRYRASIRGMTPPIDRREFLKGLSAAAAMGLVSGAAGAVPFTGPALPAPSHSRLPRWRGFNLLEKFIASVENAVATWNQCGRCWMYQPIQVGSGPFW